MVKKFNLVFVFIFIFSLIYQSGAGAITENQRKVIDSGSFYFNVEDSQVCSTENLVSSTSSRVYILGDSITVRAETDLRAEFSKTQHTITGINADVGRAISKDTFGSPLAPSGIEAVNIDSEIIKNSDVVVVALGTNSGAENINTQIPVLISAIRNINPSVSIVWVNTFFVTDVDLKNSINSSIQANSVSQNYSIIDLSVFDIPMEDGIHPTPTGIKFFAEKIATGIGVSQNGTGSTSATTQGGLPAELDPRWVPVWISAAAEFNTDPAYLGAIFTSEHGGNFSSYDGDSNGQWARPNGTKVADNSEPAAGPFQFLGSTWDDITRRMGESWPRSDRDDPVKSSRAAAKYLSMIGGVPGLDAGGFDQPQGFKPNRSEVPYTVASLAARYNQGLAWHDGIPIRGGNDVEWYANNAAEKYELLRGRFGDIATTTSGGCSSGVLTAGVNGWDLPNEGDNPMIYYSQLRSGDDPAVTGYYGNNPYGTGTISRCGCGPTSFAMIVSTLTGRNVTPTEVANWSAENGGQQPECGSYWWWEDQPELTAQKWGVRARRIGLDAAAEELKKGGLIITSVGPGSVLLSPGGNGHLLVMRAVTDDGKYLFADPSDSDSKRNAYSVLTELGSSRTPLDSATVTNGLKALFVVEAI